MTDKTLAKEFLIAISNDDYKKADEVFPKLVKSSLDTVINKHKPSIVEQLNKKSEKVVIDSVQTDSTK